MQKNSIKIWILGLISCIAMPMSAQYVGSGSSVFSFLDLPASARLTALGGDNVAISDADISMAMCNPALLNGKTDMKLSMNFCYYMEGTMFGSVIYGHNFGRSKIEAAIDDPNAIAKPNYFAVGIHYLDYGTMKYADEMGNLTGGSFGARDILINGMYARQLGPMFTVGATMKVIVSNYESYTSLALGADVGAHFRTKDSTFQMGLTLQNIGWQLKGFYPGMPQEILPINLQLGIHYRIPKTPFQLGMTIHNLQSPRLGYEYTNPRKDPLKEERESTEIGVADMIFRHTIFYLDIMPKSEKFYLSVSYNHRRRQEMNLSDQRSIAGLALGAGLRLKPVQIGFGFSQLTKNNYSYHVSLALNINNLLK